MLGGVLRGTKIKWCFHCNMLKVWGRVFNISNLPKETDLLKPGDKYSNRLTAMEWKRRKNNCGHKPDHTNISGYKLVRHWKFWKQIGKWQYVSKGSMVAQMRNWSDWFSKKTNIWQTKKTVDILNDCLWCDQQKKCMCLCN